MSTKPEFFLEITTFNRKNINRPFSVLFSLTEIKEKEWLNSLNKIVWGIIFQELILTV